MTRLTFAAIVLGCSLSTTAHAGPVGPEIAEQGNRALQQIRQDAAGTLQQRLRQQMALPPASQVQAAADREEGVGSVPERRAPVVEPVDQA